MRALDQRLVELAASQHQVFSRTQARDAGLTYSALWSRLRAGTLVACGSQALHHAGVTLTYRGALMAGLLDLGPTALVSGAAAAHLYGLDSFGPGPREFLLERAHRRQHASCTVRTIAELDRADRRMVDGLACTSPTMTVVQLLATASAEHAGDALDSACRMRLTAVPVVARRLDELGRQGRAGVARFEELIAAAIVDSWLERQFVSLIRAAGLPMPTVQRRHELAGVGVVRVDFEFDSFPIVIEVAGRQGYLSAGDRQRKERRRNALQLAGRTAYYFTRHDIVTDPGYVLDTVTAALGLAPTRG